MAHSLEAFRKMQFGLRLLEYSLPIGLPEQISYFKNFRSRLDKNNKRAVLFVK